jgi:acetyltransferase (GNAT) family protein
MDWLCGLARLSVVTSGLEIRPGSAADLEPQWRRGIGRALIRAAEDTARRLGHERLALAVGIDNPGAQRLYERLGYVDWGHGTIVGTWAEHDHDGPAVTQSGTCNVLVKGLWPDGRWWHGRAQRRPSPLQAAAVM